jgi:hypothetical protein
MKKVYLAPAIRAVMIAEELMQFTSVETSTTPVDTSQSKDPGEALSRESSSLSVWDEE